MKNLNSVIFYDNLPKLDLHGSDSETARVMINDFVNDNRKMKNEVILIVHGNGSGIIKKVTNETLKRNKFVIEHKIVIGNTGCTVALISIDKK